MANQAADDASAITMKSYRIINNYANSNIAFQGLSGIFGFPATILVDGAVIFTHYAPMIDKIRELYGRRPIEKDSLMLITKNISNEIMFDIVVDKVLGQVPLMGVYFNAICAKTLTWRLGMLFSILSAKGETINVEHVKKIMDLIRYLSPQKDIFKFAKPDYSTYERVMNSVYDNSEEVFKNRIDEALKAFEI
ncbi:MAG: hypothetical protein LUK37_02340 [Clostridia bacterium]|nr:hypothetical protein [Clostridia bacterium]